ncbi:hypothetical protein F2Q68_00045390 [Brassica cretica]|uniref:Mitochondrial adenine nucleotide transporter BTL3 n=1 Tax=Brassica cretica TaxID=69181 RepID=A0A8S9LJE3_BRACR|nr:hypothetical protein F2Q68_00045390 [Brassica cretica]
MNTRKHLWAGAVAAMVSKTFLAPLERLKLEYTVRGEQRNLLVVAKTIATTQGFRGFWKGNLLNVLRTAPFKAVNFCAYDMYRKQLLRLAGNDEATNFERFVAGAAAGITATVLCLPLDTIRTKLVARGGEALGGIAGAFKYMIQTEGLLSLYKGLVPSIASMALSGAVFYGVYDILKSSYLHTPEGRKRLKDMKQQGQELNALDKLELGPIRTLLYGAVAGACTEVATYPFEVVRRQLQMQIVRGEQRNLLVVAKTIATTQGFRGFWKGNLLNVLRTAPFKAVNFCAYDMYRKQLLRLAGNDEATNFERFVAGAAAGITATVLCLPLDTVGTKLEPLDTIRTKLVARGGEALGGIAGAFKYMIQTEGLLSLYKGLVPSIASMALSGAVFYGVYDILKSSYLHTPEGRKRLKDMKQQGQELNALDKLELGPIRTLLYGAVAGACTEVATYPFEVVRRQLQMQIGRDKLNALAMGINIIERGGIPALYAGLLPSLLQVLPSAAISYFVYECMKIVLKVE